MLTESPATAGSMIPEKGAARVLMVQGTSSSAGKSLLVAALCRLFARRGIRVAPFKAQNMSNNAAVCRDGAEIGRSQALQALAAGIAPAADMNPILLKPEADARSQIIVNGRPWKTLSAREYFREKQTLWPVVTSALDRLRQDYELVVIEGAGSPAEINLRAVEIVNMAVARYCRSPVLLVGDIERGGVFAQLLGTLWLLDDEDRRLVRGLVVNKFRGDPTLFQEGQRWLHDRSGLPVLGVIPWLADLDLPEEDGEVLSRAVQEPKEGAQIDVAVIRLPHISNFDDFTPLATEPQLNLRYVGSPTQLGQPDVVILPGTKSTMADLAWLRQTGLAEQIVQLADRGCQVVGICGGYQMLGQRLHDPHQAESEVSQMPGLGLLPTTTVFEPAKQTHQVRGVVCQDRHCPGALGQQVEGYEIHVGQTFGGQPWLELTRLNGQQAEDGAVSPDGRVWGCYLHGLFANDAFRRSWLNRLAPQDANDTAYTQHLQASLDRLADAVEASLDMSQLEQIVWAAEEACV